MSSDVNRYRADLRDFRFLLFEQFKLQDILGRGPFANWSRDDVDMVIDELYKWVCDVLGPLSGVGDRKGCQLRDGKVLTPAGFTRAWKALYEAGWRGLAVPEEHGGQGGPFTLYNVTDEFMSGSNTAFNMYPSLTQGVMDLIAAFATDEQKKKYMPGLSDGTLAGTMCLTEPHAGSDVGMSTTRAIRRDDGMYSIEGTKIFISGGDQDMSDNIIHLVLARTEDAPSGTRGLSLFIVPRDRLDGSGDNDVQVGGIEHKMGIRASSTCVLNFGDDGRCIGELVGTDEQKGIRQMFRLMNGARIGVGTQGLAVASAAYLYALDYAKDRKQGASIENWKDPDAPRVPIIEHPDVRRMLLDMKARVEGLRALGVKLTLHIDKEAGARAAGDKEAAAYHKGQVDLLVPIYKAYASDQAFQICATAIQVLGGAGYLGDHPLEQYCRDAKIFSIYEGTNHIQALDLVGRKLGQKGGANFAAYSREINAFVARHREHPELADSMANLGAAAEALGGSAMKFLGWFTGGEMARVPLAANRFLEMMGEATIGWLLLEGAVLAHEALSGLSEGDSDHAFYTGRLHAARYFARQVLPAVAHKAALIGDGDHSALDIPETAFAQV